MECEISGFRFKLIGYFQAVLGKRVLLYQGDLRRSLYSRIILKTVSNIRDVIRISCTELELEHLINLSSFVHHNYSITDG